MDDIERESTEGVTEITEPIILSLSDDLLQTKRMTIEDLIESSEVNLLSYKNVEYFFFQLPYYFSDLCIKNLFSSTTHHICRDVLDLFW
jgi:hypothetical protein